MEFIVKKTKSLNKQELSDIKQFLITAYRDEFPDYHTIVYKNPDLEITVLMYDKSTLVGHTSIVSREIIHETRTYLVGGVGDVAILPALQKHGLGINLMKYTNKVITENGYNLGLLFCHPKLHPLYSKAGWLKKEKGDIYYTKNGEQQVENTSYIYPINLTEIQLNEWVNDNIFIGEGSW